MKLCDGTVHYTPTDLGQFMESRFASWMSRFALDHPEVKPARDTSDAESLPDEDALLAQRGLQHEAAVLQRLRAQGLDVAVIAATGAAGRSETLAAMRAGRAVVFQAHLQAGRCNGIADFLVRVEGASALGAFHYEPWDAKLSHTAKPAHVIQLCAYAALLHADQGVTPQRAGLYLGNGTDHALRVEDFAWFYRLIEHSFLALLDAYDPASPPLPDPSANHRGWQEAADRRLEELDHISRVARITRGQIQRLGHQQIDTLNGLADTTVPPEANVSRVAGVRAEVFARLVEQAALQRDSQGLDHPRFRVLSPEEVEPHQGLSLLPPASPGDVFFDLEGNPLADGGLEYLWGAVHLDPAHPHGPPVYRDWWAHDARGERRVLRQFVDWLTERRARHPDLHVYHYASYELAALRRLAAREATREAELDALLRAHVFVDLYALVRQGVRVGEPSYSLKNVERLYLASRQADVASGLESVVYYEAWAQRGESRDWKASPLLRQIRDYNEEDCRSTFGLTAWLRARQGEHGIGYAPEPERELDERAQEQAAERERRRALAERMLAGIPEDPQERVADAQRWHTQALLAQLLEFHYREQRPVTWAYFDRAGMTAEERAEQPDCLAGLQRTERPCFKIKQSRGYEYRFDASQDTKLEAGDSCRVAQNPDLWVNLEEKDDDAGLVVLKLTRKALDKARLDEPPASLCLIESDGVRTLPLENAIEALCNGWQAGRAIPPALANLFDRSEPWISGHDGGPVRRAGEDVGDALVRATQCLDESVLCVQGPPGSGKTTKAARAICTLLADGHKVGITSNSHKAITNLMNACFAARGAPLPCVKIGGGEGEVPTFDGADVVASGSSAGAEAIARVALIGGTAWCFAADSMEDQLDYLFVDEAGQVSLANVAAMSRSARNLVLLGDQMQLSQPNRGTHPGESGASALDYALSGSVTIPPERGLFLDRSYRLHPKLCRFVSQSFYEGKLVPAPQTANRRLLPQAAGATDDPLAAVDAGLVFVPVSHRGNRQASDEEVAVVGRLVGQLLGRKWTNADGQPAGELTREDILVVAPYNLQVRRLQAALPGCRVGTVDKFQGQEAAVSIVSLCASDADASPRGMGFLLDPNRLNVAISRAQCLAVVVGEPRLAAATCRTVPEMQLVNRLCRIVQARDADHP